MSRQENLPPDLKAVLSLLVGRHKSYAEIAGMLGIQERAVRDRAHSALALLAPRQARELGSAERELVGEYLLGQASPGQVSAACAHLESSASARTWAQALTEELEPLATAPLPEIPGSSVAPAAPSRPDPTAPSSRRGGAIVLGGLAAIVIVAVALIVGLGGGGSHTNTATDSSAPSASSGSTTTSTSSTGTTPATTTTSTSSKGSTTTSPPTSAKSGKATGEPHLDATLTLASPDPSSKAVGIIEVVSENNEHAFLVAAEHLPPTNGFRYAAWLYNSPTDAFLLGRGPTVGSNGLLKAAGGLPANAAHYSTIVLTEEHTEQPRQPGPIVLSGAFKLT